MDPKGCLRDSRTPRGRLIRSRCWSEGFSVQQQKSIPRSGPVPDSFKEHYDTCQRLCSLPPGRKDGAVRYGTLPPYLLVLPALPRAEGDGHGLCQRAPGRYSCPDYRGGREHERPRDRDYRRRTAPLPRQGDGILPALKGAFRPGTPDPPLYGKSPDR